MRIKRSNNISDLKFNPEFPCCFCTPLLHDIWQAASLEYRHTRIALFSKSIDKQPLPSMVKWEVAAGKHNDRVYLAWSLTSLTIEHWQCGQTSRQRTLVRMLWIRTCGPSYTSESSSPPCITSQGLAGLVPENIAEALNNLPNSSRHAWLDIKRATSNSGQLTSSLVN